MIREYSVVQSWSSSFKTRALGCFLNFSIHSRFESEKEKKELHHQLLQQLLSSSACTNQPHC